MQTLPQGTVTLLFTDVEGSTRLWEEHPQEMAADLARHDRILRDAIEAHGGLVFKTVGDAFHAAFLQTRAALEAAVAAQRELLAASLPFRVRMALHTCEPQLRDGDYFGPPVNRIARILATAHGGQILLSDSAQLQVLQRLPAGAQLIDLGAHRLKDLSAPEALYQLRHPELPAEFPPLRSLSTHTHNLPSQLTNFVGREAELRDLHALLDSGARLVTLTGAGGTGKTRIALQAAADRIEQYPGGAWWIDLSGVHEPDRVMPTLAAALGLTEEPGRSALDLVSRRLTEEKALAILDNFEQVLEAAGEVSDLLRACPRLTLLVTSRAALNVTGEHDYQVSEMNLAEAVVLFAARAQQVQARFTLDAQSQPVVERICRRLDGIPLALELAAAQARMLPLAHIEKQLDQRFRTLVSPYRDVSQRQRTLRAAVDWSYDLLIEEERRLFSRLAVFVGGFTFEAAEAVGDSNDVYFGVARLREQSLLRMDDEGSLPRFRMLETLREYGLEKLRDSGEEAEVGGLHARYFAGLARTHREALRGSGREEAAAILAEDAGNLRAALEWLLERGEPDEAPQMAVSLARFWEARGWFREGRQFLTRSLAREDEVQDRRTIAQLLGWSGWFAHLQAESEEADRLQERSLTLCRVIGDVEGEANALNNLALTAASRRHFAEARERYEASLALARQLGDEAMQAARLNNLALLAMEENCLEDARLRLEEARSIYECLRDLHGIAACRCNLGELALRQQNWAEARTHIEDSLALFRRLDERRGIAYTLGNLARIDLNDGLHGLANEHVREALRICLETGMSPLIPALLEALARADASAGSWEGAVVALIAANKLRGDMGLHAGPEEVEMVAGIDLPEEAKAAAQRRLSGLTVEEIVTQALKF